MKISIWAVGKQFEFTNRQARAVYKELGELFGPDREEPIVIDLRDNVDARIMHPSLFNERNGNHK